MCCMEASIRHLINLESFGVVIRVCHGTRHAGASLPSRALRISCAATPCVATCTEMASAEGTFRNDSRVVVMGLVSLDLILIALVLARADYGRTRWHRTCFY